MTRSVLVTLLKLVVVAAIMVFVFRSITWGDTLVVEGPGNGGAEVEHIAGHIVGPWDVAPGEPIRFRPETEGAGVREIARGPQPDGSRVSFEIGFLTYWRNLDLLWFLLGALCYFGSVLFAGTRWWWLMRVNGLGIPLSRAWRFTWIGTFFNNVLLGSTGGDLVKALYAMKSCPGQRLPALVSVVVDRILGLGSLALLCGVAVLTMSGEFTGVAYAVWAIMLGVVAVGVVAFSKRVRRAIRLADILERLPTRLAGILKRIDQAVFFYRGHKGGIVLWLLLGVGNHIASVLSVLFMGVSLGVDMDWPRYFVIVPVVNMVTAIPIAPNGWGVGEAVYGTMFVNYGGAATEMLRRTQGVSLSVLFRLHMSLLSLLGGVLVLLEKDRVTRRDIEREVAREAEEDAAVAHRSTS